MRSRLVVGNWKMQGTVPVIEKLATDLAVAELPSDGEVAVCPGFLHFSLAQRILANSSIVLGAQDCAPEPGLGALTGEVSAEQLLEMGCRYVLIGHSERRTILGETEKTIAQKFKCALSRGLTPILCVGESLEQRNEGLTLSVIKAQVMDVLEEVGIASFGAAVIAYEPVWAIGTGLTATAEQAQEVHAEIRHLLQGRNESIAERIQIIYGGSVKPSNALRLFSMADIDGALVGGASMNAQEFIEICSIL
ncbi:triose-phosphate isomerase [Pseudomonas sp. ICMP22404]|uniref:triose-phosphate isomerase n=1 Tax=Pseudomonas sp. ICMP22404 TaxID=2583807 RepID=UPI00111AB1DB|nr:triose-phosphate isomerase [Pseudomonas sp. ICMP22404]TNF83401.1 triose-phosphate isomerase [Pseudomonas sp. ICMP22404]